MVEIIPKSFEEIPSWQRILLYFLILLIIVIIVGYFLLGNLQKQSEEYLKVLEQRLFEEGAPQIAELEEDILTYEKRIKDFSLLLENHILSGKFFDLVEKKTHPQVYFSEVNLSAEDSIVKFSGLADSFLSLGQQLAILRDDELVKDLALSDVSIGTKGGIEFELTVNFKDELFSYSTTTSN